MTGHRLATLLLGLCSSSCAYDWTIGEPAGGGAGGQPGAGGGGQGGGATTGTTTTTAAGPCESLLADLAAKKQAAKACSSPGTSCDKVADECGCATSSVEDSGSAETAAFLEAIAAAQDAGCQPTCPVCSGVMAPFCSPVTGSCEP